MKIQDFGVVPPFEQKNLHWTLVLLLFCMTFWLSNSNSSQAPEEDWPEYNGGPDKNHFSALQQISPSNVAQLKVAWTYRSGGADTLKNSTQIQCNPIIIKGILYGVSAGDRKSVV